MKPPKDRILTPLLKFQLKQQEKRLRNCGLEIILGKMLLTTKGTYFSERFNSYRQSI